MPRTVQAWRDLKAWKEYLASTAGHEAGLKAWQPPGTDPAPAQLGGARREGRSRHRRGHLDKQPLASSHRALQETVDRFDLIYNTERPHQGLPWRITPQQSWDATDLAEPPRPQPIPVLPGPAVGDGPEAPNRSVTAGLEAETLLETSTPGNLCGTISHPATTGSQKIRVYSNGVVKFGRTLYSLTKPMGGRTVIADLDPEGTMFASTEGEIIAEFAWPPEGTSYVGIGKARTVFRS